MRRLAEDSDARVRTLVALNHPAAPPDLLLRTYRTVCGCGRAELLGTAQFPTQGLARFADHPDPAMRRLASRDPDADPALIDRLTTDPDQTVRQTTAACPTSRSQHTLSGGCSP